MVIKQNNMEFVSCDSGLGSSSYGDDILSIYEYDIQEIPLTICNLNVGLEERLGSINDNFNDFSKRLDVAECKFKGCDAKLKEIKKLLNKLTTDLHFIPRKTKNNPIHMFFR